MFVLMDIISSTEAVLISTSALQHQISVEMMRILIAKIEMQLQMVCHTNAHVVSVGNKMPLVTHVSMSMNVSSMLLKITITMFPLQVGSPRNIKVLSL